MTTPDGRGERWRAHREARRRELVRMVADDVCRCGADIGMDDIAAETGVAKQVFSRYFSDQADLYRAVSQDSPQNMPHAGIDCYLRLIGEEPELYRYVVHVPITGGTAAGVVESCTTILGVT